MDCVPKSSFFFRVHPHVLWIHPRQGAWGSRRRIPTGKPDEDRALNKIFPAVCRQYDAVFFLQGPAPKVPRCHDRAMQRREVGGSTQVLFPAQAAPNSHFHFARTGSAERDQETSRGLWQYELPVGEAKSSRVSNRKGKKHNLI